MLKTINVILFSCFSYSACLSAEKRQNGAKEIIMEKKSFSDSTLLDSLLSIDRKGYIGGKVDSFLSDSLISNYKSFIFLDGKPGLLKSLSLKFSDSIFVIIDVDQFQFMNPFDVKRKWNLEDFKKENISNIKLIYNNQIIAPL